MNQFRFQLSARQALWRAVCFTLLMLHAFTAAPQAQAETLSAKDRATALAALKDLEKKNWSALREKTNQLGSTDAKLLFTWLRLSERGSDARYRELVDFLVDHPGWPRSERMRAKVEILMPWSTKSTNIVEWFEKRPPITATGFYRLARAQRALGNDTEALQTAKEAWRSEEFSPNSESAFLKEFGKNLTAEDHETRLSYMLWHGERAQAQRMLTRVGKDYRAVAEARLALANRKSKNVDKLVGAVPDTLQNDPGLVFDRIRWRRRKGRHADAAAYLKDTPIMGGVPEVVWEERHILSRYALRRGNARLAYDLAKDHGLTTGLEHAEAEWYLGWIALRYLKKPDTALKHFDAFRADVFTPISVGRGTYWTGRAYEAKGDRETAHTWYNQAIAHPTTYYGQLAAEKLGLPPKAIDFDKPEIDTETKQRFANHEAVRGARILAQLGEDRRLRTFLYVISIQEDTLPWRSLTCDLAVELGRQDMGVHIAKRTHREGLGLLPHAYPVLATGSTEPEPALVLALIRQESAYDQRAISPAGARGLMQLMPGTAKLVAKKENLKYARDRLLDDATYNMTLGQSYLKGRLAEFDGSYVLSLAGYNAGPHRSRAWIKLNGDPRRGNTDAAIDWVENIPFSETRNYVMRVMENLQVYRLLTGTAVAMTLNKDLLR
ncbi:MAG: lytic transglycosylase domain-containing protein [Magnetospiraceae bacterium]